MSHINEHTLEMAIIELFEQQRFAQPHTKANVVLKYLSAIPISCII